ncbi:MAG: sulfate/molybdate ABC transporter ATP-binding protein [Deltaproteobacteria bacterium]|nr:sulfate/molybdate ABC transporter ATP-binding protein [Deltaproteobacteria bacterium]
MSIECKGIRKTFGDFVAVNDVSLQVGNGELVALLGPSGSGKTTLLRIIAGLDSADQGQVLFDGEDAAARDLGARGVGFVFQHYALFRHMSVFENIAFGMRVRPRSIRPSERQIRDRVSSLLSLVHLSPLADRLPSELSGGQRQRVALARALAVEPKVLLLDEPFGALDANVRQELRRWLRDLHDQLNVTSVLVTHDQQEALEVADRVVVMNRGKVEQVGTPDQVCDNPATPFVMSFIGSVNVFRGRVERGRAHLGPLTVPYPEHPGAQPEPAAGYVRPHELDVERHGSNDGIWATVKRIKRMGAVVRLELVHGGDVLEVETTRERYDALRPAPGDQLYVRLRTLRVFVGAS